MTKNQKSMLVLAIITTFIAAGVFLPKLIGAGELEPTAIPGSTMKTLDQIPPTWSQILPASERFEDVIGGQAVLDKETGLVWAKDANLDGYKTWQLAINYCRNLEIADRKGWRLPTIEELSSLVDMSQSGSPKVPPGIFSNVQSLYYWSSTTYEGGSTFAWRVYMDDGNVLYYSKVYYNYVWPVRGGNL